MSFSNTYFWIASAFVGFVLLPLAWLSWKKAIEASPSMRNLALLCRIFGILLIIFAIANPQRLGERPVKQANIVALLADDGAGLSIFDADSDQSRGQYMQRYLAGESADWISSLKNEFQVRNYAFEQRVRRTNGFESLTFEGKQSNISHALLEIRDRLEGMPVSSIVLFSDGNATDTQLTEDQLSDLPPIYPVVIGSTRPVPDISIRTLKVSQSAFGDTPLKVTAGIDQTGFLGEPVETKLRRVTEQSDSFAQSGLVSEKTERLGVENAVAFDWKPSGSGIQFFEISAETPNPSNPEATLANNRRLFTVDRGKDEYRILYVTGRPNWEYKFLNRSLATDAQLQIVGLIRVASREPNFEFKGRAGENSNSLYRGFGREDENERYDEAVLIRMNTRDEKELKTGFPDEAEELFSYDAIVIDDLEADFFSFTQQSLIRDFVKQRGGGLLMLGGVNSFEDGGYENTPVAQALPVYLDGYGPSNREERLVQWDLSRSGWVEPWMRIRSLETEERRRIEEMPLLRVYNTMHRIRPGAETLATIEDSAAETYPALVTRKFGSGRVATLAVGDLWRWGMQNSSTQADLSQFWRQLSRWLVSDNPNLVTLTTGERSKSSILLTATAKDSDYRPLQSGNALLTVNDITNRTEVRTYEMKPVAGETGKFQIELPLGIDGAYKAQVSIRTSEGTVLGLAETGWVNQPLVEEFATITPNQEYLSTLAESTGGELLLLEDLSRLETILLEKRSPVMETWTEPLWHNPWLFILALGSFLAEWLIRRKRGLA